MVQGDVIDELHDDDGLSDSRAAEQADLATLAVRLKQVDDLDAGFEHFRLCLLIFELWSRPVYWVGFFVLIGPFSSTGSPNTFIRRPSVSRPTGTEIGAPVSEHIHSRA